MRVGAKWGLPPDQSLTLSPSLNLPYTLLLLITVFSFSSLPQSFYTPHKRERDEEPSDQFHQASTYPSARRTPISYLLLNSRPSHLPLHLVSSLSNLSGFSSLVDEMSWAQFTRESRASRFPHLPSTQCHLSHSAFAAPLFLPCTHFL